MREQLHDAAAFMRRFNANPQWLREADRIDRAAEEGSIEDCEAEHQRLVDVIAGAVR